MHFTATTTAGPSPVIDPEAPSPLRRALMDASRKLAADQHQVDCWSENVARAERELVDLHVKLDAAIAARAVQQAAFDAIEAAVVAVEYDAEEDGE